jgi:pilus assembly protein CpaB
MERFRGPIMVVGALVLAVITTFLIYNWLQKQRPKKEVPKVMQPVVVAAINLYWGTKLSPEVLKVVSYSKESLPSGFYSSIEEIKDKVLITSIAVNEPILVSKLAPEGTKAGLYGVIKKDKRAMSVKVNEVIGVAGFIYPGSHVDVLVTMRPLSSEEGPVGPVSKIILQNIPVLAAGTKMEVKEGEAVPVSVVTLEVTPEQAEKLALAANKGKIRLALRNILDDKPVVTKGVSTEGLISGSRRAKEFGVVIKGCNVSIRSF